MLPYSLTFPIHANIACVARRQPTLDLRRLDPRRERDPLRRACRGARSRSLCASEVDISRLHLSRTSRLVCTYTCNPTCIAETVTSQVCAPALMPVMYKWYTLGTREHDPRSLRVCSSSLLVVHSREHSRPPLQGPLDLPSAPSRQYATGAYQRTARRDEGSNSCTHKMPCPWYTRDSSHLAPCLLVDDCFLDEVGTVWRARQRASVGDGGEVTNTMSSLSPKMVWTGITGQSSETRLMLSIASW